jgi:heme/copper-type cytochrome/quinol oxidase subunit 4
MFALILTLHIPTFVALLGAIVIAFTTLLALTTILLQLFVFIFMTEKASEPGRKARSRRTRS